jgi:hypothetical protein
MKLRILVFLAGSFISHISSGQKETYDILSFLPPAGYERQQGKAGIQFTRTTDNKTKYCTITIYVSRASTDNVKQEFIDEWTVLIKNGKHVEIPTETQTAPPEDGWNVVNGLAAVTSDKGNYVISLLSIVGHKRVTSILIETNSDSFNPDLEKFLESVNPETKIAETLAATAVAGAQVVNTPAITTTTTGSSVTTTTPGSGDSALTGIWWVISTNTTVGGVTNAAGTGYASYGTRNSIVVRRIAFLEDGTFCQILPEGGLFDFKQQRAKNPNYWGTYHFANGSGTIKLDGLATTYPFTLQQGSVVYDRDKYEKIQRVDHFVFQGIFTAEKNPSAYQGPEPTIEFFSNGRFTDQGAIYWVRHVKSITEDTQDKLTGSGKYEISNYTITFSYDDGRLIRMTFLEAKPSPAQIRLGLSLLDRK